MVANGDASRSVSRVTDREARITWIDNARALGIVAVVLGHTTSLPPGLVRFLYAFHMPLFFFLAGSVLKRESDGRSILDAIRHGFRRLIVPYTAFFVLSWAYWILTRNLGGGAERFRGFSVWSPCEGLLYGTGETLFVNVVLWFFPCLFCVTILFRWVGRCSTAWTMLILAALLVVGLTGLVTVRARLPWSLDVALVATTFYGCGVFLAKRRRVDETRHDGPGPWMMAITSVCGLAITWAVSLANGPVSMNDLRYGNPLLFLTGAAGGIAGVVALAKLLPESRVMRWLSVNSIVIFPTHLLCFSLFTGIGMKVFHQPNDFKEHAAAWSILWALGAVLAAVPVSTFLDHFAPWVLGRSRSKSVAGFRGTNRETAASEVTVADDERLRSAMLPPPQDDGIRRGWENDRVPSGSPA